MRNPRRVGRPAADLTVYGNPMQFAHVGSYPMLTSSVHEVLLARIQTLTFLDGPEKVRAYRSVA